MSSNAPKVLVINYDEKGDYAKNHEDAKESILTKIRSGKWDFIFLCTQKSLSNLISLSADTMQHVIGEEIKKDQELSDNYTLFSKIDATRPVNSKKLIYSDDKKFRNVRIRCWRNNNIPMPNNINENSLKSTSYKGTENSFENIYNTGEKDSNLTGNDVRIVRYKYKRITGDDELQRKRGEGAIIVSLTLEKYNQKNKKEEKYQYIICSYDSPRIKLGNILKNKANNVNTSTKEGVESYFQPLVNNMPINTIPKTSSTGQKYKIKINIDNLFLTYVSCDSIVYKYLKIAGDPSFYSCLWGKNKRLKTTNGETHNLTLEQINDLKKTTNQTSQNHQSTEQKNNQEQKSSWLSTKKSSSQKTNPINKKVTTSSVVPSNNQELLISNEELLNFKIDENNKIIKFIIDNVKGDLSELKINSLNIRGITNEKGEISNYNYILRELENSIYSDAFTKLNTTKKDELIELYQNWKKIRVPTINFFPTKRESSIKNFFSKFKAIHTK